MKKFIYEVRGAEKIENRFGEIESGGNILFADVKTEKTAKKIGMKFLNDERVCSVWIHKMRTDIDADPYCQWSRYKDDSDWQVSNGWIHFD